MKRFFSIIVLLFLLIPAALHDDARATRSVEGRQTLYERYASRTDLTVAQVDGFKLNDSVKVDVLILVADDSASWHNLCGEFDIRTQNGVATWTGNKEHPEVREKWQGQACCKVIASPAHRTVCLYMLDGQAQYESLLDYQMDLMMKKAE